MFTCWDDNFPANHRSPKNFMPDLSLSSQITRQLGQIPPQPGSRFISLSVPARHGNRALTATKVLNKLQRFIRRCGYLVAFRQFYENPDIVRLHMTAYSGADEINAYCEHTFGPFSTCVSAMHTDAVTAFSQN